MTDAHRPAQDEISDDQLSAVSGGAGVVSHIKPSQVAHGIDEMSHLLQNVTSHAPAPHAGPMVVHAEAVTPHSPGQGATPAQSATPDHQDAHSAATGVKVTYHHTDELEIKPKTLDGLGSLFKTSDPKINAIMGEIAGAVLGAIPVGGVGAGAAAEIAKMGVKIAEHEIKHEIESHIHNKGKH